MKYITIVLFVFTSLVSIAQKEITNTKIWKEYLFGASTVPGFQFLNDGVHYSALDNNIIKKYNLVTGKFIGNILDGKSFIESDQIAGNIQSYTFNPDESKVLIKCNSESIYRRSTKAFFYLYDFATKKLILVNDNTSKIKEATLDPTSTKVGFVKENNLFYHDIVSNEIVQISQDGKKNKILVGIADWVYEEEFAITKAFFWSPNGDKIAFIKFDETEVQEFTMTLYNNDMYPIYETFKYPKVGEKNAIVNVYVYDLINRTTQKVDLGTNQDMYIPRIKWTSDNNKLCITKLNRHQNDLQLLIYNTKDNSTSQLLRETNKYYIDITDDLTFLDNGKEFIWSSETSGYNHIYLYNMKGKKIRNLTQGNYDVTTYYGIDQKSKTIYYQAAEISPLQRQVYSVSLNGKNQKLLTNHLGTNKAQFSSTFEYFVNQYSTINTAPTYIVYDNSPKKIRVIEENTGISELQQEYETVPIEFLKIDIDSDLSLNGWMLKPPTFNDSIQYPLFITQYSGPGSQQVLDSWKGANYWWYQQLAQNGYIVASIDPRGTGGRGEEFKKQTYLQLGKYETEDLIAAAKQLGKHPYIDQNRIGIFGWSYGGYISSLCILKGYKVFKSAIAVAPVTSWKWYDSIYTERYMRTLIENEDGYNDNSPIYFVDKLQGNYLLIHGLADDNVHFQNTAEMARALISANKQFDTYFYPNRNHGIYGDNARLHLWDKMNNFIINKL